MFIFYNLSYNKVTRSPIKNLYNNNNLYYYVHEKYFYNKQFRYFLYNSVQNPQNGRFWSFPTLFRSLGWPSGGKPVVSWRSYICRRFEIEVTSNMYLEFRPKVLVRKDYFSWVSHFIYVVLFSIVYWHLFRYLGLDSSSEGRKEVSGMILIDRKE